MVPAEFVVKVVEAIFNAFKVELFYKGLVHAHAPQAFGVYEFAFTVYNLKMQGLLDLPVTSIPVNPLRFNSAPKNPLALDSPQISVKGDLKQIVHFVPPGSVNPHRWPSCDK
jgi:hypothetical protein